MDTNLTSLNIVTLVITGILTLAAILTYLLQRARYLREIEPDLELKWPSKIRIDTFGQTLQDFWAFYIDMIVRNRSKNHAYNLRYYVNLHISPIRGRPDTIFLNIPDRVAAATHPTELLAEQEKIVPVYCGSNFTFNLEAQLHRFNYITQTEQLGFYAEVTLSYYSRRELVLFMLLPIWNWGRVKYYRKIRYSWKLERDSIDSSKFVAVPWELYQDI